MRIYQTLSMLDEVKRTRELLKTLSQSSVYGIRLNFSKYPDSKFALAVEKALKIMQGYCQRYHFLLDIPYPRRKTRIISHTILNGVVVEGREYFITSRYCQHYTNETILVDCGTEIESLTHPILYYGDGNLAFQVIDSFGETIKTIALRTGHIITGKSINCGFVRSPHSIFHEVGLLAASTNNCEMALSFVENEEDISICQESDFDVIAKIESQEGVDNVIAIGQKVSGIMVARGDLGLNVNLQSFYQTVKLLVDKGRRNSSRVFCATDILKSLDYSFFPSRAEIMDIGLMLELKCTDVVLPFRENHIHDSIRILDMILKGTIIKEMSDSNE